jgi:hypothetical protein
LVFFRTLKVQQREDDRHGEFVNAGIFITLSIGIA